MSWFDPSRRFLTSFELRASGKWFILSAIVGVVAGLIVLTIAPESDGHGTDVTIELFHQKRGFIRA